MLSLEKSSHEANGVLSVQMELARGKEWEYVPGKKARHPLDGTGRSPVLVLY